MCKKFLSILLLIVACFFAYLSKSSIDKFNYLCYMFIAINLFTDGVIIICFMLDELREHRIMKQIIENKETEFRILDMKGGFNENK